MRQGVIVLIPKPGKDRVFVKNWRPITLLNVIYKIISSTIANRLKSVLHFLIHSTQTGFISNRYIGETIRVLYDILITRNELQIPAQLLQLDFEKAFDSVDHQFIWKVLAFFGFSENFIKFMQVAL